MNAISSQSSAPGCEFVLNTHATPARHVAHPAAPISKSVFRPALSISDMPTIVNRKFVAPIAIACWSLEIWLNPAAAKMLFR